MHARILAATATDSTVCACQSEALDMMQRQIFPHQTSRLSTLDESFEGHSNFLVRKLATHDVIMGQMSGRDAGDLEYHCACPPSQKKKCR